MADQENVLDAIDLNLKIFNDVYAPSDKRAIALCWLIHLVGDIHQPLHTVSFFSDQFPDGDRGGNLFWIKPKGVVKLHSFWDGLMGESTKVREVLNEATSIKLTYKKDKSVIDLNPVVWSKESFQLAIEKAYLNGVLKGKADKEKAVPVPENYGQEAKEAGVNQILSAGHRLAGIL